MQQEPSAGATATADGHPEAAVGTWLAARLLLAVAFADLPPGRHTGVLSAGEESVPAELDVLPLPVIAEGQRRVITACPETPVPGAGPGVQVVLRTDAEAGQGDEVSVEVVELPDLIAGRMSSFRAEVARDVLAFVSAAPATHGLGSDRDLVLASRLHILRKALRKPLPAVAIEPGQPLCGNIDVLVPVDDTTFFLKGWLRDGEAPITRLTAITPEGEQLQILDELVRLELPQFEMFTDGPYSDPVDAARFIACVKTSRPSRLRQGWVFEIQNETGRAVEMYALPAAPEVSGGRKKILQSVPPAALPNEELMLEHVFPAVDRLQQRARLEVAVAEVAELGEVNESPAVSIVVPVYKRIDLIEHQLLQFDRDPEIRAEELIFVLDSPEQKNEFADATRQLSRLYDVPFRAVTMERNAGFGAATNAGAALGRGRLLLLLNSDVLPDEPGWLGAMRAFYDSTPDIGALAPKLLYEDDSLQHAGLYFDRLQQGPTAGTWANMHYFKGLHRDLPAANVARPVPAVTGACLMIDKELYDSVGGLPDVYVQGDCEDSELCLRLIAAGRQNWYLPDVELYHLEGTSYDSGERGITGSYNRWLQTHRNGAAIEDALKRYHAT